MVQVVNHFPHSSIAHASERAFTINPGDWLAIVKARPSNGDLVLARIDAGEVIARYQGETLTLPNGSVTQQWELIGVVQPIPDYFLGCALFSVDLLAPSEFIRQVN